jgi:hypothetical protein
MIKEKTIIKAFIKRGWTYYEGTLYSEDTDTCSRIFGKVQGNIIKLTDARYKNACNVHVISYWMPTTLKELESDLDKIEEVYNDLCNTRFNSRFWVCGCCGARVINGIKHSCSVCGVTG